MSVLIAVDSRDPGGLVEDLLREAASRVSATGEAVHLVSVVPRERPAYEDVQVDFRARIDPFTGISLPIDPPKRARERYAISPALREKRLAALSALANRHLGGIRHDEHVEAGDDVAGSIVAAARRLHADSIVIGSLRHGWVHNAFRRSVSQDVIRHSPVPVVVISARDGARAAQSQGVE